MDTKADDEAQETTELTPKVSSPEQNGSAATTTADADTIVPADNDDDDLNDDEIEVNDDSAVAVKEYEEMNDWQQFRRNVRMQIIQTGWFESFILLVIVVNCVFLALENPTNTSQGLKDLVLYSEIVFTVIYIVEMLLKWVGWGFWGVHEAKATVQDKNKEQKTSMFSYMVNSVFKGDDLAPPKDEYVGYFMDGWNWLDFIVVVVGSIVPLAAGNAIASVSSIRALRILRALRAIPRVPKLRVLVMTIIDAIPALSGALSILFFFFSVFGIIGITTWVGTLREQCVHSVTGEVMTYKSVDTEYIAFCKYVSTDSGGEVYFGMDKNYQKRTGTCNDVAAALFLNDTSSWECMQHQDNPRAGMENYDFIWYALLQIFQTVTMQDWSDQTYNLARSSGYGWVSFFFVAATFIVSFYSLNLILSVIVDTYSKSVVTVTEFEDYNSSLNEMEELIAQKTSKRSAPVKQKITYETYPRKVRALKEKVRTFEELFKEYNQGPVERANKTHELQRKTKIREDTHRGADGDDKQRAMAMVLQSIDAEDTKEDIADREEFATTTWEFTNQVKKQKKLRGDMIDDLMANFNKDLAFEVWLLAKPIQDDWLSGKKLDSAPIGSAASGGDQVDTRRWWQKPKPMWVHWLYLVSTSEWFEKAIIFVILLNTIILAIHYPEMHPNLKTGLEVLNKCFTVLFTVELFVKIIGLGPKRWWFDKFNVFDAVIVIISLVELGMQGDGALLAFRALRVLRVLRLLHQIQGLRVLFESIVNSFEPVIFLVLIILLFVFMFGVLGVQLFAGTVYPELRVDDAGDFDGFALMTRPWRFDNLWYSMITFLQVFTGDGWPAVMEDVVAGNTKGASLVIIVAVIIGLWLFKNMFLAILINRMSSQDKIQLMIDDLIAMAQDQQRMSQDVEESQKIQEFEKRVGQVRRKVMGAVAASKHQQRIEKIEAAKRITGKSFGRLGPDNKVRVFFHEMQASDTFEMVINTCIIINCVLLAIDSPHVDQDSPLGKGLRGANIAFTAIFLIEMIVKMIALGVYRSPFYLCCKSELRMMKKHPVKGQEEKPDEMPCTNAYFSTWWNRLDAMVVLFGVISIFAESQSFLKALRAIRPIRISMRVPRVRVVVKALLHSLPNVVNGVCFAFFIFLVLGIVGLQLFSGQFGRCVPVETDAGYEFNRAFDAQWNQTASPWESYLEAECEAMGNKFLNPGFNFDNIGKALLTVYKIAMFSNWFDELAAGMASGGTVQEADFGAVPYNRPVMGLFFAMVVFIAGFFVLNVIISVVVDSFNKIKNQDEANALLTPQQVLWVRKRRFLRGFPLRQGQRPPKQEWRRKFFDFVELKCFNYFIIGCILVNTVFLCTVHYDEPDYWVQTINALEIVFVVIFAIEAALKIIGYGVRGYFLDAWNVFDFLIVVISIVGLALTLSPTTDTSVGDSLTSIRLLRVLRVFRLIRGAPKLRALFVTLGYALPSLINIGFLMLVIFFIFGIFGVELFGKVVHSDGYGNPILYDSNEGLSASINFEWFPTALLILYRTATNDNWGSILLAAGANGDYCDDDLLDFQNAESDADFEYECGSMALSTIYFVLFTIFGTLMLVNLFIAVILDTYKDNVDFQNKLVKLDLLDDEWKMNWVAKEKEEYGGKIKGRLHVKKFIRTLRESPILVGQLLEALDLRLNIEETDQEVNYDDVKAIKEKSLAMYERVDFVGKPNGADAEVKVTWDHLNSIFKTRRLRILCSIKGNGLEEKVMVTYGDALFATCSLLVGPEFRLLPYNNDRKVHISDWWNEIMIEMQDSRRD